MVHPDRAIERIARHQFGAFTLAQAKAVGHTDATVRQRLRSGAWIRKARGVYVLAAFPVTFEQRLMAATLHKPESAVCGPPAAVLHGFPGFRRCKPEIVVPTHGSHVSPLATVHRSDDTETTMMGRLRVVTATQALFDVAGRVPPSMLRRAAEDAIVRGIIDPDHLARRFDELEPQVNHGIGAMRAVVALLTGRGTVPPMSELEASMFDLLDELGVTYERQVGFPWRLPTPMTVDCILPELALIGEADGRTWHARMAAFHDDRRRDLAARAHGYETLRLSHPMLVTERAETRAQLLDYLERRATLLGTRHVAGTPRSSAA
jgi:very-short-patch-repair endonuclease